MTSRKKLCFARALSPTLIVFLTTGLTGCNQEQAPDTPVAETTAPAEQLPADSAYLNGRIYTVDSNNTWARAIAIADGRIIAVGSNADIARHVDDDTRVFNLRGKMLMPGIHDMHVHPMQAGEKYNFQCGFPFTLTVKEIVKTLKDCAANTPEGEWIRGGQWAMELMESDTAPHRKILDAVTTTHPIYLGDSTVHGAWLNSKALDVLGINGDTVDPDGGVIVREPNSREPTGVLIDKAAYNVLQRLPEYTREEYETALVWAMDRLNQVGVTTIKDAIAGSHSLKAYKALNDSGRLSMKVSTSLPWKMSWTDSRAQELENIRLRDNYAGTRVNTGFVKIMLDGIPPARTSAMLEPYRPDKKHGDMFLGKLIHAPQILQQDITDLDARGLTVKIHATGDRAVRVTLDAIESARKENGNSGLLHEISHAELIHPDDIPRFKELNVIAELSPILWYPSPLVEVMAQVMGEERAGKFWPIKSLQDAGTLMIYGSDWPSVVPDPNPWPGIEAMISRKDPYGIRPGVLWPEQSIDLATVIRIFTVNGAVAAKREHETGSIEVGKSADFIVLDQNIFEIAVDKISETKILSTLVSGVEVYKPD